jgi:thiol:disulfide interchange protein DsbA
MNRREFSAAAAVVLGATALGVPHLALAQQRLQAGKDYRVLDKRVPVVAPAGKIEVVEFFWYSCPHCNAFEPLLEAWRKRQPAEIAFRRVPVGFRDDFVPQQRMFYTLEAMGKLDELHAKIFQAIHKEGQPTDREDRILAFVARNGVDRARFQELYNSAAISEKARAATALQDQYMVDGVPAMGIAGRFYTDGTMALGMDRMLVVVDHLVAEARKAR